jgi:spore germination protein GerM
MAGRGTSRKTATKRKGRVPAAAIFLLFFLLVLVIVFFALAPASGGSLLSKQQTGLQDSDGSQNTQDMIEENKRPADGVAQIAPSKRPDASQPQQVAEPPSIETPDTDSKAGLLTENPATENPTAETDIAPVATAQAERPQTETRERGIFFVQVENDGESLKLARVSRNLAVSDAPLGDSLAALLSGPSPEEAGRGMTSFMPPEARILGVRVQGNTAYINFNEFFQYNTRGREGLAFQVQQVVWTATEFSNVKDVQILIEGSKVDFLEGGLRIGSPIGRSVNLLGE